MAASFEACRVRDHQQIVDALRALERGAAEIALVVDEAGRLVGTLTDGDVRRALLAGATLDSPLLPHVHREFTSVGPSAGRAEVLDLMRARTIGQIPIVDGNGQLVGLHLLHRILGSVERENVAVVMAGGRGTRLWPLTATVPKPLLPVAGRPILERIVLGLVGFGVRRIYLSVNYLGHLVEEYFRDGSGLGCHIEYLREDRPLGTAGSLALLPELPAHSLLVMNGDLVTQADLGALIDFHERGGQQASMCVRRYAHTVPFGVIELEGDRVVAMEEKPQLTCVVNAGIYVIRPDALALVERGEELGMPALLERCLARGDMVRGFEIEDDWIDVGQRDQLQRARGGDTP